MTAIIFVVYSGGTMAGPPHRIKKQPHKSPYFEPAPHKPKLEHLIDRTRPSLPIFPPDVPEEEKTRRRAPFMDLFLDALREHGSRYPACVAANVSSTAITDWVRQDIDGFRDRYYQVQQEINDRVEQEILRRGAVGWEEPVFQGGKQVGTIRKFSDVLLIFYAKARMPERYRDKYEGANLIAGDQYNINMVRNDVLNVIAQMPEEELERLAGRGRMALLPEVIDGDSTEEPRKEPPETDEAEGAHTPGAAEVGDGTT